MTQPETGSSLILRLDFRWAEEALDAHDSGVPQRLSDYLCDAAGRWLEVESENVYHSPLGDVEITVSRVADPLRRKDAGDA
jgi:hypothetical protein